jgi:hypothetical protein
MWARAVYGRSKGRQQSGFLLLHRGFMQISLAFLVVEQDAVGRALQVFVLAGA